MRQRWEDLLFLHWASDPAAVQASLPEGLRVDTFEGRAWVAVVPFFMRGVRPVGLPAVPGVSDFLELNLRTYAVDADGVPGVWFYSLDADQWLAVKVARTLFRLPYEHAAMSAEREGGGVRYDSLRRGQAEPLRYAWRPRGEERAAEPRTLEFFLLERYVLFSPTRTRGVSRRGRVHHEPYRFADADVTEFDPRLFALNGLAVPAGPPDHVACCAGVDVEVFPLRRGSA